MAESSLSSFAHSCIFTEIKLDTYLGLPRGAPRCGRPSLVIFISVSPKRATASDSCSFLMNELGLRGVRVVTKAWSQTGDLIPPSAKVSNLPGTGSIVSIPRLLHGGGELLDQGHSG